MAVTLSPRKAKILPWLISIAFFMQMLDSTIVNTALPAMARSLGENPLQMQAVVISYLLTVALLIPASGWLADRFGTRRIFLLAIFLFTLGSVACAMSPSLKILVLSRVLQGAGGALLVPVGRLIVLKAYPRSELIRLLSFITMSALIGPLFGPILGGIIVEYTSWNWIFLINIPVGLVGFVLSWLCMPDIKEEDTPHFDWFGFVVFGAGMVLLSLALDGINELDLARFQVAGLALAGAMCLGFYWWHASRAKSPLFSLALFGTRTFTIGILGNLISRLGSGALPFLLPLLLQLVMGYSPSQSGLLLIFVSLSAIFSKLIIAWLVHFLGYRAFLCINTALLGLLICAFSLLGKSPDLGVLIGFLLFLGVINANQFTSMNTLTLMDLPDVHTASGNSLLSVVMQLSVSLGVGFSAALLKHFERWLGPGEGFALKAFDYTFICVGVITLLAGLIFMQVDAKIGKRSP